MLTFKVAITRPGHKIGIFQPGESRRVDYSIDLVNENLRGVTIYYVIQWTTVTDPKAVSTAGQILAKQVSAGELATLSTLLPFLIGTITYPR